MKRHPFHDSLCAIALTREGITVIPDTRRDTQAGRVSATEGAGGIRFYAGIPLHDRHDILIGTLCVWDTDPHHAEDYDFSFLHDLALLTEGELIDADSNRPPPKARS